MEDSLISRQSAIDAIYEAFCYAYCDNCEKEMNEDLCGDCHRKYQNWSASKKTIEKVINNLPSAQPEQRWIPVTERLPECGIDVLTVDGYGEYEINHIIDEEDGEWYWEPFTEWMPVTAWMPLPKPYKAESEPQESEG